MGFLNVLGKLISGTVNFMFESSNSIADQIDRMSDAEIKKKYPNSSVDEMRKNADVWHSNYKTWKSKKEEQDKVSKST